MTEPSPQYTTAASPPSPPDAPPAPVILNGEHHEALELVASLYGFSQPGWPADKVRRLLRGVVEVIRRNDGKPPVTGIRLGSR